MTQSRGEQTIRGGRFRPPVGPRLKKLLALVFGLFALLSVNSAYLASTSLAEWSSGETYQNRFYLWMFLLHLILGLFLIVPVLTFAVAHIRNTHKRPNRRAVRVGYGLFITALLLFASGILLVRLEGLLVVKDPVLRGVSYWVHVVAPLAAVWLFILHRLAGRRIRWRVGLGWAAVAALFALAMLAIQTQTPERSKGQLPVAAEVRKFFPSLAQTSNGELIPAQLLMNDQFCRECHEDVHESWASSVHRFSSFNNPAYAFAVREARQAILKRDGNVKASRFCAGCHDPVPLFAGLFDDSRFEETAGPTAKAGITCTVCHSITEINSPRGNADYIIESPVHYPFAFSQNSALRWINRQLIKAKPAFHKKTFLKPIHKTAEFCGSCHKVHLPKEVNGYKWLRAQNHYDSFLLSGVSGHSVSSFYYPPKAESNCNQCHMPLIESEDFGAAYRDDSGRLKVHNHLFPSANTAIPHLLGMPPDVVKAHQEFQQGIVRIDIFALREGGTIEGRLLAPLGPQVPALKPGRTYLVEVVIRTVKIGHALTQGTADSNQVWVEARAVSGDRLIGVSGGLTEEGVVDPWSHFINAWVLDRNGRRIDRRNAQDIFVSLYDNQIGPGAADVVHYLLHVPEDLRLPIDLEVAVRYRKFDTTFMKHVFGPDFVNDLPITTLAADRITFPLQPASAGARWTDDRIPLWERWNDYGIGLLNKGQLGQLRQAEEAFLEVEKLGRPEGAVNLARVYLKEGLVQTHAPDALARARAFTRPAPLAWSLLWFSGLVNKQNGNYREAVRDFEEILKGGFPQAQGRDFDFGKDYWLLNELAQTLYLQALQTPNNGPRGEREKLMIQARDHFLQVLELDPENLAAHWGLKLVYRALGDLDSAARHEALHALYKPDDNARDAAILYARRDNPAADHAADSVVIYDLQRPGALKFKRRAPELNFGKAE